MPRPWRPLTAAALLALLPACPDKSRPAEALPAAVDAGPPRKLEAEPNDAQSQSLALDADGEVDAQLAVEAGKPDSDWYVLAPPQPRVARVELSGIPGADVAVEVLDAAGARRALVNGRGEGQGELLPNLYVDGKAWLKVSSAKKGAGGAYTLSVRFEAPLDGFEREPDDRAVDAVPAPLGSPVRGYITHGLDEDWYRVELPEPAAPAAVDTDGGEETQDAGLPAPRALKLELTALGGVRPELSILTEAEAVLLQSRGREGAPLQVRNVGLRPQDRFVYVVVRSAPLDAGKDARRGSRPEEAYALTVQLEESAGDAELEPNDALEKATPLPAEGERHGFLSPAADVDCYALSGTAGRLLRAELSGVEGVDLQLSLVERAVDGGEVELLRANEGGEKEPERLAHVACAGECWLRVAGVARKVDGKWVKDQENAAAPYALQVSSSPDDGSLEREPNNAPARAVPLGFGALVRGTVFPQKDVDLYRVDLSARPVKTPLVATVTGVLKVDVGLYLHRVGEDGGLSLVQTSDGAKGDKPEIIRYAAEPGVYVLEVRDARNRDSNFQDSYVLGLEEGQE